MRPYKSPFLNIAFFVFCLMILLMLREIVRAEKVESDRMDNGIQYEALECPTTINNIEVEQDIEQGQRIAKAGQAQAETYTITAYCSCEICCGEWADGFTYSGDLAVEGITAAADLSKLPLGTVVNIEGWGERTIQDIGGKITGNKIDLFFWNHADALKFGIQELEVEIYE